MAEQPVQGRLSLFVNGRARQVDGAMTLGQLAESYKLDPKMLLVERNGTTLLRDEWPCLPVEHGDRIEFIRVVAGG